MSEEQTSTVKASGGVDAPVDKANRIDSLDFIRGIAVMGILWANIVAFGQPMQAYMYPEAFLVPASDQGNWMWIVQFVLIDGKMRGLFTLLFGAGMYLFLAKAWERGSGIGLQARRLFWLLLFGLVHFLFIWRGDILVNYALCGLVALLFVKMTAKSQLILGIVGYVAGCFLYALLMATPYLFAESSLSENPVFADSVADLEAGKSGDIADGLAEAKIIGDGRYGDFVAHNFAEHGTEPFVFVMLWLFETLPLILIGMALYRVGLFNGGFDRAKQLRWGWIGVIGGAALTLPIALWGASTGPSYYGSLAAFMGFSPLPRLPMILGLAAVFALWGAHASGWLGQRIKAAGRAAFSNYLGTSIVMLFVFHGFAGGLHGELNRPELYIVVAATWVLMLLWSKPWLERFRFGPLEWLWRCLTYGKLFPLKRQA